MIVHVTNPYYLHLTTPLGRAYQRLCGQIEYVAFSYRTHEDARPLVIAQHCTTCAGSEKDNRLMRLKDAVLVSPLMGHYAPEEGVVMLQCRPPLRIPGESWSDAATSTTDFLARFRTTIDEALRR